jgi:hypothetical protein
MPRGVWGSRSRGLLKRRAQEKRADGARRSNKREQAPKALQDAVRRRGGGSE